MLNPIDMMDNLVSTKESSDFLFHNKPMLKNIKIWFNSKRMVAGKYLDIASWINESPPSPEMAFFTQIFIKGSASSATVIYVLMASCKFFRTLCTRFLMIQLPVSIRLLFVPDIILGMFPVFPGYFSYFHKRCIVNQFMRDINGF